MRRETEVEILEVEVQMAVVYVKWLIDSPFFDIYVAKWNGGPRYFSEPRHTSGHKG